GYTFDLARYGGEMLGVGPRAYLDAKQTHCKMARRNSDAKAFPNPAGMKNEARFLGKLGDAKSGFDLYVDSCVTVPPSPRRIVDENDRKCPLEVRSAQGGRTLAQRIGVRVLASATEKVRAERATYDPSWLLYGDRFAEAQEVDVTFRVAELGP